MVEIRQEFIEQASYIARNAEVLPGGIEELAIKLQHSADTNTPLRILHVLICILAIPLL